MFGLQTSILGFDRLPLSQHLSTDRLKSSWLLRSKVSHRPKATLLLLLLAVWGMGLRTYSTEGGYSPSLRAGIASHIVKVPKERK